MRTLLSYILLLTVFLTLYGLLHYYFYVKSKNAFMLSPLYHGLLLAFLFSMLVAPILINISIRFERDLFTTCLAYIGYTWMAALFLFFSIHLMFDVYNGICHLTSLISSPVFLKIKIVSKASFLITLLMVTVIITYGMFEAQNIRTKTVVLKTKKLPPDINGLRIVQISDIHFSATNSTRLARKIVKIIKDLNPDILVSTGDLIDRDLYDKGKVAALFRDIKVPYGKYAVTGNHEFYTGIEEAVSFTEEAGFMMLRNEGITAGDVVNIAGIDDPTSKQFGFVAPVSEDEILKKFSNNKLTILLKHQPRINEKNTALFDLQLSGHTHKGQIFPFSLISARFFPYHNGLFKVGKQSYLYVTSGTGTWGPPVRFLSPPEITVILFSPHP
ncbi:MAG: metallophosphoesterase [Desulfobacteraceae bacterium]|nr:metallophosphoesterase [Desulfobacteraceae bacterium]